MTGAPKLRSVQLLEEIEEHRPRGIYSGTFLFDIRYAPAIVPCAEEVHSSVFRAGIESFF
jgi:hypothetical protein